MPALQNPKHEQFAKALAAGKTQIEAYEQAGYKSHEPSASRLRSNAKVQARIKELQAKGAEKAAITIESLINEAAEIQKAALEADNHAAAVSALTAKAKLAGLWIEKAQTENTNANYAIGDKPATDEEWAAEHVTSH